MTRTTHLPRCVLMTADTVGGVWTYALELCRGLGERGVHVVLATMGAKILPNQRRELRALNNVTCCESRFRLEWMTEPWNDVERAGEWLLELEQRFTPDLVHLNGYAHAALPWRAPRMVVGHSCVLSWWTAVKGRPAPAEWHTYDERVRAGLHAADLVVAPSHAMLDALIAHYGPLDSAEVIANGRDPVEFVPGRKQPFVLSVGRLWDEAKNTAALAHIAPHLPWPVRVAGDTRRPDGVTAQLANVDLLGRRSARDVRRLFARASIYALPARYEPFGLSVLEAALSRCALVLGDIPSLRENWDGAAEFVPPDDSPALLAALQELISNPIRRDRLAALARQRAHDFTTARMLRSYLAAYDALLTAAPALSSS